jgi:CD109 antigen
MACARGGFGAPMAMMKRGAPMEMEMAFDNCVAMNDMDDGSAIFMTGEDSKVVMRQKFPETFIFESLDLSDGKNVLTKTVPDTITSWIITAFAVDPITGLGMLDQPKKLNVFQPFFVSTNLPYSIKRGEVVSIPIIVFNYMEQDQQVEVSLFNQDNEFEFAENGKITNESKLTKFITVKSNDGTSVNFIIKPLKAGNIKIKVVATSGVAGDGLEQFLIVEPEGVTQYMNKALFIDLRHQKEFKTNFRISIPENAVPDSTKIEISAIGDILGPSIENLDKLM